jgi:hypothetical protein
VTSATILALSLYERHASSLQRPLFSRADDGLGRKIGNNKGLREHVCAICTRPFYFSFVFIRATQFALTRRSDLS